MFMTFTYFPVKLRATKKAMLHLRVANGFWP